MVESCFDGLVVVFLCVVGRAAAKDWLCQELVFIDNIAKYFYKLQSIRLRHTVVYDEQLVHLGLASFDFRNAIFNELHNFSALNCAIAFESKLFGLGSHPDYIYGLIVDNQSIVVVLADFSLLKIVIEKKIIFMFDYF